MAYLEAEKAEMCKYIYEEMLSFEGSISFFVMAETSVRTGPWQGSNQLE